MSTEIDNDIIGGGEIGLKLVNKKSEEFSGLLNKLNTIDNKKKLLWKEIYRNSIYDRNSAYMLFNELHKTMGLTQTDQVIASSSLAKYLDKINKANDQLIKLAELIAKEEYESSKIDEDDMYDQIGN